MKIYFYFIGYLVPIYYFKRISFIILIKSFFIIRYSLYEIYLISYINSYF